MTKDSYSGYEVVKEIKGVHPIHEDYPLLPKDLLVQHGDEFDKVAEGVGICGFQLSDEQLAEHCRPVQIRSHGLNFTVVSNG